MKIIKISKDLALAIYFFFLAATFCVAALLWMEYRFFVNEADELSLAKDIYSQQVEMLKRSLDASLAQQLPDFEDGDEEVADQESINLLEPKLTISALKSDEPEFEMVTDADENQLSAIKKEILNLRSLELGKKKKRYKLRRKNSTKYLKKMDQDGILFSWPIDLSRFWLSSLYGPRRFSNGKVSFHHAIDMASLRGTPVKASASGRVILAQHLNGYGNCIMIQHAHQFQTRYAHLDTIGVRAGQEVKSGQFIGSVGDTGFVRKSGTDASHLHFEIHKDYQRVNPLRYLFL